MDKERIFGQIFLPDTPDQIQKGVWLNTTSDSIFLEVPLNSFGDQYWDIILGEFNGMDKVTFVNARTGGGSAGAGGSWRKIEISYLIKGVHIKTKKELEFTSLTLISPALTNWIIEKEGIERIKEGNFTAPDNKEIFSVSLEKFSVSTIMRYNRSFSCDELSIFKEVILYIKSDNAVNIDEYSSLMRKIKRWILFVTNKDPEFSKYHLVNDESSYLELINTLDNLKENKFAQNISFGYHELKGSVATVFKNWIENEKLETIIDLLQEKQYNTDMSFQSYFLNMCVAIETFHSIFGDESKNSQIQTRIDDRMQLLSLIEDERLKKRFESVSQRWHESTYRERLKSYKDTFEQIMGDSFKFSTSKLINKIVNTRNALAHSGTYKDHLSLTELLLVGKVLEFTIKHEIINLLDFKPENESDVLEEAATHVKILANLNKYS
jgi:hypothetical protein